MKHIYSGSLNTGIKVNTPSLKVALNRISQPTLASTRQALCQPRGLNFTSHAQARVSVIKDFCKNRI